MYIYIYMYTHALNQVFLQEIIESIRIKSARINGNTHFDVELDKVNLK